MSALPTAAVLATPLVASLAFGTGAPRLARRLHPRTATWLLSSGSVVLAASTAAALALVVLPTLGELPVVAAAGHWSARHLAATAPFEEGIVAAAIGALAVLAVLVARTSRQWARALGTAWRASRALATPLVVLPDPRPTAFALPGWPGRIVASLGLVRDLAADERRVVLAHEQAHLDGRHDLHLAAAALAGALDPMLAGVPAAVHLATERWADEQAAAGSHEDRALVARTIAKLAACAPVGPADALLLFAAEVEVPLRVAALLQGAPRRRPLATIALAGLAGLALAGAGSVLLGASSLEHLFDAAAAAAAAHAR